MKTISFLNNFRIVYTMKQLWKQLKAFWRYIWDGEGVVSWVLSVIVAFIIIRFIFYPLLGLLLATSHPVVAIVSGSMEHRITVGDSGIPDICGSRFPEVERLSTEEFWNICGPWYESQGITREQFMNFPFRRGMNTGDVILLRNPGAENIEVGDVIVFIQEQNPILEPIIHRVVGINDTNGIVFQTKGDHNEDSIFINTTGKYLNEFQVTEDQLVGRSIARIPYIGYVKIWAFELYIAIRRAIA